MSHLKWKSIRTKLVIPTAQQMRDKQDFFEDVLAQCKGQMPTEIFEFFMTIIIPDNYVSNRQIRNHEKATTKAQKQMPFAKEISHNIFSATRETPYEIKIKKNFKNIQSGNRIVSTPKRNRQSQVSFSQQLNWKKRINEVSSSIKNGIYQTQRLYQMNRRKIRQKTSLKRQNSIRGKQIPLSEISTIRLPERSIQMNLDFPRKN